MQGLLDLALSPGFCPEFGRDAPVLVGKQDALGGMLDLGQRGEVGAWTALGNESRPTQPLEQSNIASNQLT